MPTPLLRQTISGVVDSVGDPLVTILAECGEELVEYHFPRTAFECVPAPNTKVTLRIWVGAEAAPDPVAPPAVRPRFPVNEALLEPRRVPKGLEAVQEEDVLDQLG